MEKKYNGKAMASAGRYQDYLKTLDEAARKDIYGRVDRLVGENAVYCDKGNYGHLCNIFSAIAIYAPIFKKYGMPELGPMFCHADDINYGHLKGIKFTRRHTLSSDGQACDFLFTRE